MTGLLGGSHALFLLPAYLEEESVTYFIHTRNVLFITINNVKNEYLLFKYRWFNEKMQWSEKPNIYRTQQCYKDKAC